MMPAQSNAAKTLDTTLLVVTPENVAFDYRLAGPAHRAIAMLVDMLVIALIISVAGFVMLLLGLVNFLGLLLVFAFLLLWFYGGLMETFFNGQTLGKKSMGLRVVSDTGLSINASQAVLRNILRYADLLPPFIPGVVVMVLNRRFQRMGDLAVGTIVIIEDRVRPRPPFPEDETDEYRDLIPMNHRPRLDLIEALAGYVGSRSELSPARRRELAEILTRHFQIAWSLPRGIDPDLFLCAMYESLGTGAVRVAEVIERRTPEWRLLEQDITWSKTNRRRKLDPARVTEFGQRYRSACSDLALAVALRFPVSTVRYLHQLVADAHTQLYRSESFRIRTWATTMLVDVPLRIVRDPCTWIAFAWFWTLFVGAIVAAQSNPGFAAQIAGDETLTMYEAMYAQPLEGEFFSDTGSMGAGFYVFHNAGIGLRCFASGTFLGIGSLFTLAFNGVLLGVVFGHMLESSSSPNFIEFVTAHAPFELTAVALSGAAGLRLGWSLVDTRGFTRSESFRRTAPRAMEIAGAATVLFLLAAMIEGFISPTFLPYELKLGVAIASMLVLLAYIVTPLVLAKRRPEHEA